MMTTIGKILAFVNLLIGLAMLSWAVTIYTQRPSIMDAKTTDIDRGQHPVIIAQLKEDIEKYSAAATAASANWGVQKKLLDDREAQRAERQKGYGARLQLARDGNPKAPDQPAFFEPVFLSDGFVDLNTNGAPILAEGEVPRPLRAVNRLGGQYAADVAEVIKQAKLIDGYRDQFKTLSGQVLETETRALKMGVIRDSVQAELFYLATVEVNVYETRETVQRRKAQLNRRLEYLGARP